MASSKDIPHNEAAEVLERWWKGHGGEAQIHAYYCVLGRDYDDAFVTVIRHADNVDAWITENVKELGWKRIYGLSSCKLESANALVIYNRDVSARITNPSAGVPIAKIEKTVASLGRQDKKGSNLAQKEHVAQEPDFGTELPEGVSAADFHQNLFKPVTISSKRRKGTKGQGGKGQAMGISAMFQAKSQTESSPPEPASPKKVTAMSVEGDALHIDFTSEDEPMPPAPIERDTDVKMAEPEETPKECPRGMSKYLVTESTGQSGTTFGRRAKKPAAALS